MADASRQDAAEVISFRLFAEQCRSRDLRGFCAEHSGPFFLVERPLEEAVLLDLGAWLRVSRELSIGRSLSCHFSVDVKNLSRRHGLVEERNGSWFYKDLGSANGSRIGEALKANKPYRLKKRQKVVLGKALSLTFMSASDVYDSVVEHRIQSSSKGRMNARRSLPIRILEEQRERPRSFRRWVEEVSALDRDTFEECFPFPFLILLGCGEELASNPLEDVPLERRNFEAQDLEALSFWVLAILPEGGQMTLGRDPDNDMVLRDESISRRHASIHRRGERWTLRDEGSSEGCFVDAEMLFEDGQLKSGALIRLGSRALLEFMTPDQLWLLSRLLKSG